MTMIKRALCASLMLLGSTAFAAAPATPTATTPRLYALNCGTIAVSDVSVFSPGVDVGKKKTLTDSCYLIVHPKGTLMWDTGLNDEIAAMPGGKKLGDKFHGTLKRRSLRS